MRPGGSSRGNLYTTEISIDIFVDLFHPKRCVFKLESVFFLFGVLCCQLLM